MMLKINYAEASDFDFMRWTNNLLQKYNPVVSPDPEYVIASPWRKHDWYDDRKMLLITHENYEVFRPHYSLEKYHAVLGLFPPSEPCNFVQFPYIAVHNDLPLEFLYDQRERALQVPKTEFCCFLSQNKVFGHLAMPRIEFFQKLSQYKKVMAGGGTCNNLGCRVPRGIPSLRWINQFKFMICFENSIKDGYVSEKPFEPWFAGTVPIYAGDFSKLNPKAYINGLAPDAIDRIIELDNNNDLYETMRREELTFEKISLNKFHEDFERQVLNR